MKSDRRGRTSEHINLVQPPRDRFLLFASAPVGRRQTQLIANVMESRELAGMISRFVKVLCWNLLISFSVSSYAQSFSEEELLALARDDVASYIKVLAASMQQQVPLETGAGTVVAVSAFGTVLGFVTELDEGHRARTKQEQMNYVCSASFLRAIIDNGGTYAVQYVRPDRTLLSYVEVETGDCQ